jgi:NADH-quinone oxidoreductase subunit A
VLNEYGPVLIFVVLAVVFPLATLALTKLVRPTPVPSAEKLMPYECGITPESDSRGRYTVRFYLIAILFVIFDVETIFLFPWAVQYQVLGLFGLIEMLVFLGILIIGYIWIWKRGALEWV